jgi:hypothetical protein
MVGRASTARKSAHKRLKRAISIIQRGGQNPIGGRGRDPLRQQSSRAVTQHRGQRISKSSRLGELLRSRRITPCMGVLKSSSAHARAPAFSNLLVMVARYGRSEGSSPSGACHRATALCPVDPSGIRTMMHLYASAAKLRGGGPNLRFGLEARSDTGSTPTIRRLTSLCRHQLPPIAHSRLPFTPRAGGGGITQRCVHPLFCQNEKLSSQSGAAFLTSKADAVERKFFEIRIREPSNRMR